MRLLKILLYLLFITVLQTVVLARFNLFGFAPDLILVSVIIFAVLGGRNRATLFAAGSGFIQDILCFGVYLNVLTKVVAAAVVAIVKESFLGNEYALILSLVAVLTPGTLIVEGMLYLFVLGRNVYLPHFFLTIIVTTILNLIVVPILLSFMRQLARE
ncbi:rod shape-determining protein MreD [candidate division WOR-1 bacterium RIFCSPLOWO2_02_FULL_46_20]|uniref:Rod shape-determining protein MreD n=2 Tax=Saganbacteria TaxID=1703751 RepID=A0A1F4RDS9_UNCSA|nr:MAG: rod shape-determining protein MreD [candidate division WOR-1 bacterium RIFCSPHIGHO2_02_FULL_45_12]OGC06276.1 MAG: rod shape-determining protein MreD [candidate division WOR-1 bacterium RIFCSPLOWO2_02_FULL_46_20]OGC08617.1 MAG: rod shape-determining protein MreD [candidate division WOR-1 bacterium RIFCSPLOWO2_12_FULL_45_9]